MTPTDTLMKRLVGEYSVKADDGLGQLIEELAAKHKINEVDLTEKQAITISLFVNEIQQRSFDLGFNIGIQVVTKVIEETEKCKSA